MPVAQVDIFVDEALYGAEHASACHGVAEQPVPLPDQTVPVYGTRHGGTQCFGEPGGQKIAFCAREKFAAQLCKLLPPLLPECQGFSCPGQGKSCVE